LKKSDLTDAAEFNQLSSELVSSKSVLLIKLNTSIIFKLQTQIKGTETLDKYPLFCLMNNNNKNEKRIRMLLLSIRSVFMSCATVDIMEYLPQQATFHFTHCGSSLLTAIFEFERWRKSMFHINEGPR
jgi:hypothetical protein